MTLAEYKDLVDSTITNKTVNYSITPTNVGERLKDLADNVGNFDTVLAVPLGTILMYAPATTSEFDSTGLGILDNVIGWAICNGNNTTPNLKGKFVVGYDPDDTDYNAIGDLGGDKTVTLDITQIPQHDHMMFSNQISGGSVTPTSFSAYQQDAGINRDYDISPSDLIPTLGKTGLRGGGLPHENRPPFYTVLYIKKIA